MCGEPSTACEGGSCPCANSYDRSDIGSPSDYWFTCSWTGCEVEGWYASNSPVHIGVVMAYVVAGGVVSMIMADSLLIHSERVLWNSVSNGTAGVWYCSS